MTVNYVSDLAGFGANQVDNELILLDARETPFTSAGNGPDVPFKRLRDCSLIKIVASFRYDGYSDTLPSYWAFGVEVYSDAAGDYVPLPWGASSGRSEIITPNGAQMTLSRRDFGPMTDGGPSQIRVVMTTQGTVGSYQGLIYATLADKPY